MELVRWEPFEGLSRLHNRINDLFDEGLGRARTLPSATAGVWMPSGGYLWKARTLILIRAELPGMRRRLQLRSQ